MKLLIKRYSSEGLAENPLWLVVLGGLMTNLMLFFIIMYVFSSQSADAAKSMFMESFDQTHPQAMKEQTAQKVIQKFTENDVAKKLAEEIYNAGMKNMAEVQITEKQIKINIAAPVLFKSGKAKLSRDSSELLGAVGKIISRLPNDIIVEGHTDNIPIRSGDYATNWELSAARAITVADFLADNFKIPNERIICAAYVEHHPAASNSTSEGRARNRRIEIIVSRK